MSDNHTGKEPAKQNGNGRKDAQNNELTRKLRTPMLFTLGFSVFTLVVVALTTDMMFLREEVIILPIPQFIVPVPIVAFYVVAPLLIVLLHLNLLVRLILLARDIYNRSDGAKRCDDGIHVNSEARTDDKSSKVYGVLGVVFTMLFPIDPKRLMPAMREAAPVTAFLSIGFLILVTVPLLILLVLQARFLAYQDEGITFFHQIVVTVDLFFQFMFTLSYIKLWGKRKRVLHKLRYLITAGLVAIPAFYAWAVALVPDSYIESKVKSDWQQSIAGCFFPDWWKKYKGDLFPCDLLEGERSINIQSEIITLREQPPDVVGAIIQIDNKSNPEMHCAHVGKLDLAGRRLFYANFSGSTFMCAKMEDIQLNGSKLTGTKFRLTRLLRANLSDADLREADFEGADLGNAILSGADLRGANLRGAWLSRVRLSKAEVIAVFLRGDDPSDANLSEADFEGADPSGADLSGTDLLSADLSMANLRWADLSGADLFYADLSYADLKEADLSEANLMWADLSGADFSGADLKGADMRGAEVYGARLYVVQLRGTILEGAKLFGANFSGSTPRDTTLGEVDVIRPKGWDNILVNIKYGFQEKGYPDDAINARLEDVERNGASALGYVPPTGTDHCNSSASRPKWNLRTECAGIEIRR